MNDCVQACLGCLLIACAAERGGGLIKFLRGYRLSCLRRVRAADR